MDASQVACLDADSQALDEVMLSDRAFVTDPAKIVLDASEPQKLRFRLIEWLAESPNRKVKAERKQAIAQTLAISTRQVERMLNQYREDRLRETAGVERADKGQYRIDDYWQVLSDNTTGEECQGDGRGISFSGRSHTDCFIR
jgi:putative transposase